MKGGRNRQGLQNQQKNYQKNYQSQVKLIRQAQTIAQAEEEAWESHRHRQEHFSDWIRVQKLEAQKLEVKSTRMLSASEEDLMNQIAGRLNEMSTG